MLALLLLLNPQSADAAFFETLSIKDGLSQNSIYEMAQGKHGYIWIATNDGLNRYDGKNFIKFKSVADSPASPSLLTGNNIFGITEDKDGHLWVATQSGLNYFNIDNYTVKRFTFDKDSPNPLSSQTVRKALVAKNGHIWVATNQGLDHIDPISHKVTPIKNNDVTRCSGDLRILMEDHNGHIWIGTNERGLCKYNPVTKKFIMLDYQNDLKASASVGVRALILDGNFVWVGSLDGLFKYNLITGKSTAYRHNPDNENSLPDNWIQTLSKDNSGNLWVGTSNGLAYLDTTKNTFTNYKKNKEDLASIGSNNIYSTMIDQSGLAWFGSYDAGISIYNPKQKVFNYIGTYAKPEFSISNNSVWAINKAYGYVWIGTSNGLNRYDPKTKKIKQYIPSQNNELQPGTSIYTLVIGDNDDIWLGTRQGLVNFNVKTEVFESYTYDINDPNGIPFNNTIASRKDQYGNLWLGFYGGGAAHFNPKTKKFIHYTHNPNDPDSISNNSIYDIIELSDGRIIFGSDSAVNLYIPESGSFKKFSFSDKSQKGLSKEYIAMKESLNGNLFLGTNNGIYITNSAMDKVLKLYSKKDGLDDDYIYSIEEDDVGNIWVSTNRGISRINPITHEIKNFDISDGLQDYEFNGKASFNDGQYLYFGGFNGLNFFDPSKVGISNYIPPIVITAFKKNDTIINKADLIKPIQLSYKDTYLSIEFSALDYTSTQKNQYAYKMEGFDKDWIYSGNRSYASYTNLDAGNYTFRVKGANKYGNWNKKGASLSIQIEASPWKRWWAYSVYLSVLILIIFLATRSKILADSKSLSDQIRHMSATLNQTMDLVAIQQQMAEHMKLIFPYYQFMVFLKEDGHFIKGIEKKYDNKPHIEMSDNVQLNFLNHVADKKQPLLLKTRNEFEIFNLTPIPRCTLIALPLMSHENIIGIIIILNPGKIFSQREDRINIAITLGIQASAAIDNAHLFNKTKQLAFYDALTGLENRRLFKERLELALKVLKRNNSELSVMFLDLDKFKRINDSLGHDKGDTLLIEAAKRLKSCIRNNDTVARIGGDEFMILLTDTNGIIGAQAVAKKILKAFQESIDLQRHIINVSVSIGIAMAPRDSIESNMLMKHADTAMYKAKDKGRNNYQFFTEEMNIQASKQLDMENDIRRAIKEKEFILHYQPLINIKTQSIIGVEALVRWQHPSKGLIPPMTFIPVAEETGLISALGEQILVQAFSQAKIFSQSSLSHIKIAVNLSVKQFIYGYLIETIENLLQDFNISANWLELEITENVLIENTNEAIHILNELKKLGTTLAIDDFGTGYSSLSYLKQLPIDTLKVDRSFVKDIPGDVEDVEITAAIIAMAHKLNLQVVAEGVETLEQLEFLKLQNCDIAQGYYFHKPMPAEELMKILRSHQDKKIIHLPS